MIYRTMKFKKAYNDYFFLEDNKDIFTRLNLTTSSIDGESFIILALNGLKVVGTYAFENYDINNIKTLYLQVEGNYKNKGIGTQLIKILFDWAKDRQLGIITSQFSVEGERYVKNQLRDLAEEYNINYFSNVEEYEWFD